MRCKRVSCSVSRSSRTGRSLPAAKVRGGGGGGGDTEGNGGAGFGITAKPAGVFVIRDGDAEWKPALDLNRVILGGQLVAIVAFLALRAIFRRR